jgi:hypothetical protein
MKPNDMKDTQHFQLIDGTFTPAEASRVLLSLVKSKIDYHNLEKLSNEERFGRDLAHSEKRLRDLAQLNTVLKELCASAAEAKQNLKISGWIDITFVQGENASEQE